MVATYRIGHDLHAVILEASIEAKRWKTDSAIGVKPMMRLISRLKHRDLGVLVTTSYFDKQVQQELIEDGHPVLLVSGDDIARLLISKDFDDLSPGGRLSEWIDSVRSHTRTS